MTELLSTENIGNTNANLPFSIDKMSFINWMSDLDLNNKVETLKYLSIILKTLKQGLIKPEDSFFSFRNLRTLFNSFLRNYRKRTKTVVFLFLNRIKTS